MDEAENILLCNYKILTVILFAAFGPEADYRTTTMTLVFSPTATSFTVPVVIIDDSYLENDEPFSTVVNLATADPSITITPNSATITILNDDSESCFLTLCNIYISRCHEVPHSCFHTCRCDHWFCTE